MPTPEIAGEMFNFHFTDQTVSITIVNSRRQELCVVTIPLAAAKALSVALRAIVTKKEAVQGEIWIHPEVWERLGKVGVSPNDWPKPINIPDGE